MWYFNKPDPFCGGTRTFAWMWRGDLGRAVAVYPLGPLLFVTTVGLVVWMTLIHERVQGDLLGRVNSIDWLVSTSLMPIALAVVGPLADAFGVRALLVVAGFGGALLVLSFLLVPGVLAGEELRRDRLEPT